LPANKSRERAKEARKIFSIYVKKIANLQTPRDRASTYWKEARIQMNLRPTSKRTRSRLSKGRNFTLRTYISSDRDQLPILPPRNSSLTTPL
jgi:hypothetical protein